MVSLATNVRQVKTYSLSHYQCFGFSLQVIWDADCIKSSVLGLGRASDYKAVCNLGHDLHAAINVLTDNACTNYSILFSK